MTILLNVAFSSATAAQALASALKRMPLEPSERTRLSASWAAYRFSRL